MGKGKTFFVSGCSRGVGLALAKELLSQPDERIVFAAARSPHKSEELQKLAKENKDRLHIITFDVTDGNSAKVNPSEAVSISAPDVNASLAEQGVCECKRRFSDLLQEAAEQVQKILGRKGLDVLINNAGTSEDLVPPLET